jgi:hypothetical protein
LKTHTDVKRRVKGIYGKERSEMEQKCRREKEVEKKEKRKKKRERKRREKRKENI